MAEPDTDLDIAIRFGDADDLALKAATDKVLGWLDIHAERAGLPFTPESFALVARRDGDEVGILTGMINYQWLYIRLLAVNPERRKSGIGGELLRRAEQLARAKGCVGIWLDTYSYQAPDFYPRHGFVEFGRIADYPPGQDRLYFQKRLS